MEAQAATRTDGQIVISAPSSRESAPTDHDTVVVYDPTASTYGVSLPAGSWTKVLDTTGAVSVTGNTAGGLAVSVFKRN